MTIPLQETFSNNIRGMINGLRTNLPTGDLYQWGGGLFQTAKNLHLTEYSRLPVIPTSRENNN